MTASEQEPQDSIGMRVITTQMIPYWERKNGKGYRPGKIVATGKIADFGGVIVELEPIGKERKSRQVSVLPEWIVPYTEADAEKIRSHVRSLGMEPAW